MKLTDLKNLASPPPLFAEHDNIPWHEPAFSERMLGEHLDQAHNLASRKAGIIDAQVEFIHSGPLGGNPARILDLGCGPGFYANRLAKLGHHVKGIDFSPASIDYAREHAEANTQFVHADIRTADYGGPHDLALLLYGEFNVFREVDIKNILEKLHTALAPGGRIILEVSSEASLKGRATSKPTFGFHEHGLFHPGPHLLLEENYWYDTEAALATRYTVIDILTNEVRQYGASYRSYVDVELSALISEAGFEDMELHHDLNVPDVFDGFVLTATKPD